MTEFITLPRKAHNLAGRLYGRLVVLGAVEIKRYPGTTHVMWACRCECGADVVVAAGHLRSGNTSSCGCAKSTLCAEPNITHGHCRKRTAKETPEYGAWRKAKGRCFDPNDRAFDNYGGRGITMCDAWANDFAAFLAHVGPRPSRHHSLDRIENDGHYEPGNVRWATRSQQSKNRRKGWTAKAWATRRAKATAAVRF